MTLVCKSRWLSFIALFALLAFPAFGQDAAVPSSAATPSSSPDTAPTSSAGISTAASGGRYDNSALNPLPPSSVISNGVVPTGYVLGPGDVLAVTVQPQDKYSLPQTTIEQDGTIEYPRLGSINAAGLTIAQIHDVIAQALAKYCINPDVTVQVVELRPQVIYITGGVKTPQILDLRAAPNVAKAVTLSGGALDNNELAHVTVFRGNVAIPANVYGLLVNGVDTGENISLQPGDLIVVPINTAKYAVVGAVSAAGVFPLTPSGGNEGDFRLADALAAAGGTVRTGANVHSVEIVRELPDGTTKSTAYDYGKYVKTGDIADNPSINDKDLIFVPDSHHSVSASEALGSLSVLAVLHGL